MAAQAPSRRGKSAPFTGIQLEMRASDDVVKIRFGGRVDAPVIRKREEACMRAADRCTAMAVIFEEHCDATSALIGLVMRLHTHLKAQGKAMRVKVLSPRMDRLLRALHLDGVLRIVP